ncbi:hypothetical protein MMC17_005369 [Xylographa soralifera]|nr:hypothetical protein [Xylographa soralifera]
MGIDDYTLGRDYRASARLHVQHHLWSETLGYVMNPAIPSDRSDLAIADVGTGTGIWLLELDRRLPTPATRLCGLDISADQFPRAEWLPSNAEFVECDALDPNGPPADLIGVFDIVHIRLFIAIIKNNDPTVLLDFCHKLLKPGGFLQWDDHEPSVNQVGSYKGSPTEGMEMISRMTQTHKPTAWIARLPTTFGERGFEVVDVDSRVILPWQRGMYTDNYCILADEFVERAGKGGSGINPVDDFYQQLSAKASAEKQLGSYMEQTLQIVVGRKV